MKNEIGLFKSSLVANPSMDAKTRSKVKHRIREMTKLADALPKGPSVQEVARLSGFGPTYLQYRLLSGAAAHVSLKSTMGYLGRDKDGYTGHVIGPDFEEAEDAIHLACFALMTAIEALRQLVDVTDYDVQFQALLDRFNAIAPY